MRERVVLAACGLAVALWASRAEADLAKADDLLLHGDYASAAAEYRATRGKQATRATLGLARALLRVGEHAGAEQAAAEAGRARDAKLAAEADVVRAEILRATGRGAAARTLLAEVVRRAPGQLRARLLLGRALDEAGDAAAARREFEWFFDAWDRGELDEKNAEQLLFVAVAARYLEAQDDANDVFRDAVRLDPMLLEANLEWGALFLEKYAAGYAEQSFDEVLKVDPHHPDAHAGMARVKLEQNYDARGAREHVGHALRVNPRHEGALAIRAELEIDNAQIDDARRTIAQIVAVNPTSSQAHALSAAIAFLADDAAAFATARAQALAANPKDARFFHVVAELAVKAHRYTEAIALEEQALAIDPGSAVSLAALGTGLLRLGDEARGLEYLNRSWDRDKYNVRSFNVLNLFDEVIPTQYDFTASKHLRFRVLKTERKILERYVPRKLETAWADMVRRYGFEPKTPVTVELFADSDHYSVRTVGLPNLGAIGVCFGPVITAVSPSNPNINWAMVLWHELGHVFAIQLSKSRVPRWFTEGLSEYETIIARPEWRRENDVDLFMALEANALPSVVELNSRFLYARDMNEVVVAYHLSSAAVEFLATRFGFPKIVQALRLYGQGKTDAEVLTTVTGLDVPTIDRELRAWLEQRLAAYAGSYRVRLARYEDRAAFEQAAVERPKDAEALAELALAQLVNEDPAQAQVATTAALALDPKNRKALFAQGEIAYARGATADAKAAFTQLVEAGGDGFDARIRLGRLALAAGEVADAERHLLRAKEQEPERSEPSHLLGELYGKQGKSAEALCALERYALLEQMEYAPHAALVARHTERKAWDRVRTYGEIAVMINPWDVAVHLALGRAHLELGAPNEAIYEYESALLSEPPAPRPALAHLGLAQAWLAKQDRRRARQAVDEALRAEPGNAEATALKKLLR